MRTLAMHQPNFLPWLGYFDKIKESDIFVLMDTAQVPRGRSWATRVKIKRREGGWRWLSLPTHRSSRSSYREARVAEDADIWGIVAYNYQDAEYFDRYADELRNILCASQGASLADANEMLIRWACQHLGLDDSKLVRQSDLGIEAPKGILPIELCKAMGCDVYLSGTGARSYNQPEIFEEAGIELQYEVFEHPIYPQLGEGFIEGLSIIDFLFNCDSDSTYLDWKHSPCEGRR